MSGLLQLYLLINDLNTNKQFYFIFTCINKGLVLHFVMLISLFKEIV